MWGVLVRQIILDWCAWPVLVSPDLGEAEWGVVSVGWGGMLAGGGQNRWIADGAVGAPVSIWEARGWLI